MEKLENLTEDMKQMEIDEGDQKMEDTKEEVQNHPDKITAEYVKQLTIPTNRFLCKLSDNWAKFRFGGFKIRDMVSKITLVDVPDQGEDE